MFSTSIQSAADIIEHTLGSRYAPARDIPRIGIDKNNTLVLAGRGRFYQLVIKHHFGMPFSLSDSLLPVDNENNIGFGIEDVLKRNQVTMGSRLGASLLDADSVKPNSSNTTVKRLPLPNIATWLPLFISIKLDSFRSVTSL